MAQQLLYGTDIVTVLKQVGREAVPECMTADFFTDIGSSGSGFYIVVQCRQMNMMSPFHAGARIGGNSF